MSRLRRQLPLLVALVAAPIMAYLLAPDRVGTHEVIAQEWYSNDPAIAAAQKRTFALRDSNLALQQKWRQLDSREKAMGLTARGLGLEVRVDRDVPAVTAASFAERARTELTRLTSEQAYPIVLRISVDSLSSFNYSRVTMLPERPGAPCVAMVRLSSTRRSTSGPVPPDQVLGLCGLYAKFGAPGAGVDRWLERTRMRTAAGHTGSTVASSNRAKLTTREINNGAVPVACLAGRDDACLLFFDGELGSSLFLTDRSRAFGTEPQHAPRLAVFGPWQAGSDYDLGLHNLRASLGDDRFALIWRSASEPAEAFALNEGTPLASWVRQQLELTAEPYHAGPMVGGMQLALALVLVAAFWGAVARFSKRQYRG